MGSAGDSSPGAHASTVLLVGGSGQLGCDLRASVPPGVRLHAPDRIELDLLDDASVARQLDACEPDLVINAAAYTAVERAESERELAFAVNGTGVRRLAAGVAERGGRLIHVSTDFVFDGESSRAYRPGDAPSPLSVYGASKLDGELAVAELIPERSLIVRTSWLYSAHGSNFVLTMLRLLAERPRVEVVADQLGSPTWAATLAGAIWGWAGRPAATGLRHWADDGVASWYELATATAEEAIAAGRIDHPARIEPIPAADYPSRVVRPQRSALDASESYAELDLEPLPWREALRRMLRSMR